MSLALDKMEEDAFVLCINAMGLDILRGGGGAKSSSSSNKLGPLRLLADKSACGTAARNMSRTVCLP